MSCGSCSSITATDASRIDALAYSIYEHFLAVQRAFDDALIDGGTYRFHTSEFADLLTRWPGLRGPIAELHAGDERYGQAAVFGALNAAAAQPTQ